MIKRPQEPIKPLVLTKIVDSITLQRLIALNLPVPLSQVKRTTHW